MEGLHTSSLRHQQSVFSVFVQVGPTEQPLRHWWHCRALPGHTATPLHKLCYGSHTALARGGHKLGRGCYCLLLPVLGKLIYSPSAEAEGHLGGQQGATHRSTQGRGSKASMRDSLLPTQLYLPLDSSSNSCGSGQDQQQALLSDISSGISSQPGLGHHTLMSLWWHKGTTVMPEHLPLEPPGSASGFPLPAGRANTGSLHKWLHVQPLEKNETGDIEMELSAAETASAADPEELIETSGSASTDPTGHDQAPSGHAAGTSIQEEQDSQMFPEEEETKGLPSSSSEESASLASVFSCLSFPQKLWVLVESDQVKSIQWGHGGNCIVIQEEMFKVEVLAREAPARAFESTCMKSFVRQLNLYGFTKVPQHLERSFLPQFLAEGEAFAAHRKVSTSIVLHTNQLLQNLERRMFH